MNRNVERWRTERAVRLARERHGDLHPATFAAIARAVVAWRGRFPVPYFAQGAPAELAIAYGRALHRAAGNLVENRHVRARSPALVLDAEDRDLVQAMLAEDQAEEE